MLQTLPRPPNVTTESDLLGTKNKMLQYQRRAPTKADVFLRVAALDGVNESCRLVGYSKTRMIKNNFKIFVSLILFIV